MGFSECLKELRKDKKCTQRELAKYLGFSTNIICEWENQRCEPKIDTILKLADFFGVPTDYLLGRIDDPLEIVPIQSGVPTVPGLGEISPMEKELITRFRKLPGETQDYLLGITRNLTK